MTTILIKKKDTAGAPAAGDLTNAAGGTEIAVNTATKRIYTKDAAGNVVELGTNATSSTIDQLTVTTSATLSYGTANGVTYLNGSKVLTSGSALTFDGTTFGVNAGASIGSSTAKTKFYSDSTYNGIFNGASLSSNEAIYMGGGSQFFFTGGVETFRTTSTSLYTASGINAGFGTSNPQRKLDAQSTTADYQLRLGYNASFYYDIGRVNSNGYLGFYGSQTGATGFTFGGVDGTWATISSTGNVGIGTSSPSQRLSLQGSSTTYALAETTGTGTSSGFRMKAGASSDYTLFTTQGVNQFAIYNNVTSTQPLTITSADNVGIGTTTPAGKLQVGANGSAIILDNVYSAASPPTTGNDQYIFRDTNDGSLNFSSRPGGGGNYKFWNGATQLAIITNAGNVGIGTSSPAAKLHIAVPDASVDGTKGVKITNSAGTTVVLECGVSSDSFVGTTSGSDFSIRSQNIERLKFPNAGGVQAVTTISVGNATPSSSGAGITFPATQSASSNANTLDDYEEGTFEPTLSDVSGNAATGYSIRSGFYTKIGNSVTALINITLTNKGAMSTALYVLGLPFSTIRGGFQGTGLAQANWSGLSGTLTGGTYGGALYLYNQGSAGQTNLTGANVTNTSQFDISVTYTLS